MLSNILNRKYSSLSICLMICLAAAICIGLLVSLPETAAAYSHRTPVQLEISVKRRITWGQGSVEYRVLLDKPEALSTREVTLQYKVIDQQTRCNAMATWSENLARHRRHMLLNKWKTKPNYLFLTKNSALKYLGKKFCFRVSKASIGDKLYFNGYAEIEVEKWWNGVQHGGVCPSVYAWIEDSAIMRGGQTTLHWKIANVRHPASVRVTARNHNYWFYDTSQAEPNIKKKYGNPHEVASSHNAAADTVTASRTVIGHLAPRTDNLYVIQAHRPGCPIIQDAVFMRVID